MPRSHDAEEAAAGAVQRVLGGVWTINDTGAEPGQVDVFLDLDDGTRIAMEETSEDVYDRYETRSAIDKRAANGEFEGERLTLAPLGVESAILWNANPPSGESKILVGTSWSAIGTTESLPTALERVLSRTDNQKKLAAAEADERHLYLRLNHQAAASGLQGLWPLPDCPPDPCGVIDVLWVFAPWASSALLHRVIPGGARWQHLSMRTGEPLPESALSES